MNIFNTIFSRGKKSVNFSNTNTIIFAYRCICINLSFPFSTGLFIPLKTVITTNKGPVKLKRLYC